jgi:hypothetical protein
MADGTVTKKSLILKLKDVGGQTGRLVFVGTAPTVSLAKTFALTHCDADVIGASMVEEMECATVAGSGELGTDNIDRKLIIHYKNATTNKNGSFAIPAYLVAEGDLVAGERGQRLTKEAGDDIVAAWKTAVASTDTLVFTRGIPIQRS